MQSQQPPRRVWHRSTLQILNSESWTEICSPTRHTALVAATDTQRLGKSFAEFNAKYVDGRQPYPWLEVLPLAGLGLKTDTIHDARLGFAQTLTDDGRVAAVSVTPGGVAASAGVKAGDIFVSVGSVKIEGPESFPLFRKQYANAVPGSALPIVVHRGNEDVTLNGTLRFVTRAETRLTLLSGASKKAVRIRTGILSGTID